MPVTQPRPGVTLPEPDAAVAHGVVAAGTFKPHPLLRNPHLQTIIPTFFRPRPPVAVTRERLEMEDGDFIDLGWIDGADTSHAGPILVMIHGLGGSIESKYALGLGQALAARGWRPAILQLRGAGPEPNRRARAYHHGDTADFHHVCTLLKQRHPRVELYAAGWSLGANLLLKALGEKGAQTPVRAAAAGCAPFQLAACAEHLRHGLARPYQNYLLRALRSMLRRKFLAPDRPLEMPPQGNLEAALRARDFFDFDDAYTAPLNGFADARDYYARSSCGQFLKSIVCPTLVVNALDDPFLPANITPPQTDLAPSVRLELCQHGGHVGFIGRGTRGGCRYWLEERFIAFFESQRNGSQVASP